MAAVIVVSDTGPLHYLILLGRVDLLAHFFGEVFVPSAVIRELSHLNAPELVRDYVQKPPPWIKEVSCPKTNPKFDQFGIGEREALTVAMQNPGSVLLCDDGAARSAAISEQIAVSGTLGILRDAALSHLLNIREEVERLRTQTNFRGSKALLEAVCVETEMTLRSTVQG